MLHIFCHVGHIPNTTHFSVHQPVRFVPLILKINSSPVAATIYVDRFIWCCIVVDSHALWRWALLWQGRYLLQHPSSLLLELCFLQSDCYWTLCMRSIGTGREYSIHRIALRNIIRDRNVIWYNWILNLADWGKCSIILENLIAE